MRAESSPSGSNASVTAFVLPLSRILQAGGGRREKTPAFQPASSPLPYLVLSLEPAVTFVEFQLIFRACSTPSHSVRADPRAVLGGEDFTLCSSVLRLQRIGENASAEVGVLNQLPLGVKLKW